MSAARPLVAAPAGPVLGLSGDGVRRFLGIPYAQAPVGALRFAAPEPLPPFPTVFDASRHGATPQRVPLFATTTIPEPSIPGEATLNLDVFAPEEAHGAPILFWIHGGGYIAGSPASPWYDGSAFAREGVIVVNASYRLGLDGFGIVPGAPADRGLRDLIAALRWVRENAAAFGGDPGRVTIAGQSAGGGCVLSLLASPAAQGLFQRAVSVSGVDLSLAEETVRATTVRVAERLGVPPTAEGFGPVDDGSAMRALLAFREEGDDAIVHFGPVAGDDILPLPVAAGLRVTGTDIPLLLGSTADEFDGGPTPENPDRPGPDDPDVLAAKAAGTRLTDTLFRSSCVRVAGARAEAPAGTWLYTFDWPSPVMRGATHCIDVPFLLGTLDREGVREALGDAPPAGLGVAAHGDLLAFVRGEEPAWPTASGVLGDAARCYGSDGRASVVEGAYDPCVATAAAAGGVD